MTSSVLGKKSSRSSLGLKVMPVWELGGRTLYPLLSNYMYHAHPSFQLAICQEPAGWNSCTPSDQHHSARGTVRTINSTGALEWKPVWTLGLTNLSFCMTHYIHACTRTRTFIFLVSSSSKLPMSKASAALTSPLGGMRGGSNWGGHERPVT